jgi:hypothetical protein
VYLLKLVKCLIEIVPFQLLNLNACSDVWMDKHQNADHHYVICSHADMVGAFPDNVAARGFYPLRAIPHYYLDLALRYVSVRDVQAQQELRQEIGELFHNEDDEKVLLDLKDTLDAKVADKKMLILKKVSLSQCFLIIIIISL